MFTILAKNHRITAADFEGLRRRLVDHLLESGREDYAPWEDWIAAVHPSGEGNALEPRPLDEENLKAFACWALDAPSARIISGEPPAVETLQALHDFAGWSLDEAANYLGVSKRTYQRWLSGSMVPPVRVEGEMRQACGQVVDRAKLLADANAVHFNLGDSGVERRAHALAEVLFRG